MTPTPRLRQLRQLRDGHAACCELRMKLAALAQDADEEQHHRDAAIHHAMEHAGCVTRLAHLERGTEVSA